MEDSNIRKVWFSLLCTLFSCISAAGFIAFGYVVFFDGNPKVGGYGFLVAIISFGIAYWFHLKNEDDGMGTGFGGSLLGGWF